MFTLQKQNKSFFFFIFSLVLIFIPGTVIAKDKNDTLRFVHLTDIHLILNPISYDSVFIQRRYNYFWDDNKPFTHFLDTNLIVKKSDFIVITGDMIDFYEAESKGGGVMGNQIELFQSLMNSATNSIVYLTLGNHDITSYPKGSYHQNNANNARATWIKNTPIFNQGTYYSKIYKVGNIKYRLIFLDNAYFSVKTAKEQADFIIDCAQLDWLKSQLNESPDDKEIIFMHMPLPVQDKQIENDNNPFLNYEIYANESKTKELLDIIKETVNASVQLIVAGHNHKNEFFNFKFSEDFNINQIKTGAFGNSVENLRLFQLTESDIIISNPDSTNQTIKLLLK